MRVCLSAPFNSFLYTAQHLLLHYEGAGLKDNAVEKRVLQTGVVVGLKPLDEPRGPVAVLVEEERPAYIPHRDLVERALGFS